MNNLFVVYILEVLHCLTHMFASCLVYAICLFCKDHEIISCWSPRDVAKGMWSSMLYMVASQKVIDAEDHSQLIYQRRSFHSFKYTCYSLHSKFQMDHKRPFLIHLANFVLQASINYYIMLKGMKSTMMKLKMKMEKEEKEE